MSSPLRIDGTIDPAVLDQARSEMEADHVPGLAIGIFHEGRSATAGLGVTQVERPWPVDGDTLFQIGSVTKTFTATAILQLVEAGRCDLDDPIRAYLPEFAVADPGISATVTIRDCLTHSSGWHGDVFENTGWGDDALARMVARMAKLTQATPHRLMWSYNNAAFYPLGRIVEVLHGRSYESVISDMLFDPLGMDGACFFAHDLVHRSFAVGHAQVAGNTVVARPWAMPRSSNPVGGVVASAEHLMRYGRQLLEGGPILGDVLRLAAYEPSGPANDTPEIGLGWWLRTVGGEKVVQHGGGANGQPCLFMMVPSRQFAMVVLTNGMRGRVSAERLIDWVLRDYLGLYDEPTVGGDDSHFDQWVGTYEAYLDRYELRRDDDGQPVLDVTVTGEWLDDPYPPSMAGTATTPVAVAAPHTLTVAPGDRGEMRATVLDGDGRAAWLRYGLRAAPRV